MNDLIQTPEPSLEPPDPIEGEHCICCGDEIQAPSLLFPEGPVCRGCLGEYIQSHYTMFDLGLLLHVPVYDIWG